VESVRNRLARIDVQTALVGAFILATIFSVEFPVLQSISEYASINSEDFALLLLFIYFTYLVYSRGDLRISLPRVTLWVGLASLWIVVTLAVALIRSPEPVTPSVLWLFKWFAGVISFLVLQNLIDRNTARVSVHLILLAGLILATYSIVQSILGAYRIRVFFGNPNTLAAFFTMVGTLSLARAINGRSLIYLISLTISAGAVLSTGSRSGLLGLIVALFTIIIFLARDIRSRDYAAMSAIAGASLLVIPNILDESVISRLTGWVTISSEGIALADTVAAESFRIRVQLIERGIELFIKQPIFGYGWFAVPSRVGYLDVYYTILLVEIGLIGFVLFLYVHLLFIRSWLTDRTNGGFVIGSACAAWYCGLLTQSIAGAFPRTPQILLLTFVLLVSSKAIAHEPVEE
jgi:hypothetical protein